MAFLQRSVREAKPQPVPKGGLALALAVPQFRGRKKRRCEAAACRGSEASYRGTPVFSVRLLTRFLRELVTKPIHDQL